MTTENLNAVNTQGGAPQADLITKNTEFVKAALEFASGLDENSPVFETGTMVVRLANALKITNTALREKSKQCDALADLFGSLVAENVALDTERLSWAELYADEVGDPEVMEKARGFKTPATDTFLREVRAQGAENAAAYIKLSIQQIPEDLRVAYHDAIELCSGAADKLRKGGAI